MAKNTKTTASSSSKANPNPTLVEKVNGTLQIKIKESRKEGGGFVASFFSFAPKSAKVTVTGSKPVSVKQEVTVSRKGKTYISGFARFKTLEAAKKAVIALD